MTPLKRKAAQAAPQSITDVEIAIARIGRLRAELAGNRAAVDAHILTLQERAEAQAQPVRAEIDRLSQGVQSYCETRRNELTDGARTKLLRFQTGTVSWRKSRAHVEIDNAEAVIARLKQGGLAMFVRLREEIDKLEVLKRPALVARIDGIRVVADGAETFVIEPKE